MFRRHLIGAQTSSSDWPKFSDLCRVAAACLYRCTNHFAPFVSQICGAKGRVRETCHFASEKQHLRLVAADSSRCRYALVFMLEKASKTKKYICKKTFYKCANLSARIQILICGCTKFVRDFTFLMQVCECVLHHIHCSNSSKICECTSFLICDS